MSLIGYRSYEVPAYVHGAHVHAGTRSHVGAVEAKDVLEVLTSSPLSAVASSRKYGIPSYVAGSDARLVRIGATDDASVAKTDPASDASLPVGVTLAIVAGVLVVGFLIEVGVGYVIYKAKPSLPLALVVGFFTGGPVGIFGTYVGAKRAMR